MKVKLYRGSAQPKYTLYLPASLRLSELSELSGDAQAAIKAVGDLTLIGEDDLSNKRDAFSIEIKRNIVEKGAFFSKWVVRFEEIQGHLPR